MKDLEIYTTGNNSSLINNTYVEDNSTFAMPVYVSEQIDPLTNLIIEPENSHIQDSEIKTN